MSFVDDVTEFLKENPGDVDEIPGELGCAVASYEFHDETRWTNMYQTVFQLKTIVSENPVQFKDEYVLVEHHKGSTEMQEDVWESYPPEVFAVEPYIVEVVKYKPV